MTVSLPLGGTKKDSELTFLNSGKSSLILTLLGLLPPLPRDPNNQTTMLAIDDVPVSSVDPQVLRSQLITIPQDPVAWRQHRRSKPGSV